MKPELGMLLAVSVATNLIGAWIAFGPWMTLYIGVLLILTVFIGRKIG